MRTGSFVVEFLEQRIGAAGFIGGEGLVFGSDALGAAALVTNQGDDAENEQDDRPDPQQQRGALAPAAGRERSRRSG